MKRSPAVARLARPNDAPKPHIELEDGARVAVIGGGPAGSLFSYFLLQMSERAGREVLVDVFEPRDFWNVGPSACNMCGGIISETLVQNLAADGINLPDTIVQRGIDSYVLHVDAGSVRIETPLKEMRIGAVHRASGPRDLADIKYGSFDGYLQTLAIKRGASVLREQVTGVDWDEGRPIITTRGDKREYDLVAVATGVNTSTLKLFEQMSPRYRPPATAKTFIREYLLGADTIARYVGSSMHVFLLDLPGLEFAAIIPKGDYVSICLLGDGIGKSVLESFLSSPEVARCMPPDWDATAKSCQCSPRINVASAVQPFADRIVFVGDAGATRLFKDGIGAAYRTAKSAATTAVFEGISESAFRRRYWPTCRKIEKDNSIGKVMFSITGQIQRRGFARRAVLRMASHEQTVSPKSRRMSMMLWDLFTGSAPYREILNRGVHPSFITRFTWDVLRSLAAPSGRDRSIIEEQNG
jgi:flavin-dependent dehydrogenase